MDELHLERRLLRVGKRLVPLIAGEVQFWRLDPSDWDAALRTVAAERIPVVSTYMSWRRHALEPDAPFAWRHDERLDVHRFLRLCVKHDLLVQLKPGPWICAEEPNGGYPDWLVSDSELLALDAEDNPIVGYNPPFCHPVPSYLHPRYLERARHWIHEVNAHVEDFFHPRGPVVLIQLDNEPSYCFRDGMYEADYHPVTLGAFANWTLERYGGSLNNVERAWNVDLSDEAQIVPPRPPRVAVEVGSGRWCHEHDWISFREWLLAEHLRRLAEHHRETAAKSALFTVNYNTHVVDGVPQSPLSIQSRTGAIGGMDHYYEPPLTGDDLLLVARSTALGRASGEPLPWSPEIQAGIWRAPGEKIAYGDPTPTEQELYYLAALAFGLKGLNFYMLVNRENWEFAPIESDGTATPYMAGVRKVVELSDQLPDFGELEPVSPVALAWQASYARDAHAGGASDPSRRLPYEEMLGAFNALTRAGFLPRIWHSEQPVPNDVAAIVTPTAPFMPHEVQQNLVAMSKAGVQVILLGEPPHLDQQGQPCDLLAQAMNAGDVESHTAIASMLDGLGRNGIEAPVRVIEDGCFAILQQAEGQQLLFVLNSGSEDSVFHLRFASDVTALLPLTGDSAVTAAHRTAVVDLAAHAGAVFEVVA